MKYLSILFASVLLFSISDIKAQKESEKPSTVIFTAGWSYADLNQGSNSTDTRNGFYIGLRKDVKLFPTLHLETGALYVQKGATFTDPDLGNRKFELDYIDIPAALKLRIAGFYGLAGVSGNIKVKSAVEGEKVDNFQPFSLSSSLGAGFKFLMFSIDARWNHTLTDIVKNNDGDNIYNSYFLIGLSFHLKRK